LEKILLIAVVGGGLQGVEVAYLSKKAGWEVMVLDKNSDPPAKGLVDYFVQVDVCRMDQASGYLEKADLVLPALENDKALETLALWQKSANTPLCFDLKSYNLSSSKKRSNNLFTRLGIPKPLDWPECGFPIVVKPSLGSGSQGVRIISSEVEWVELVKEPLVQGQLLEEKWVIEEYVNGPSYSLEIIGSPGNYKTLQVTELYMDSDYDCKRVIAPAQIGAELIKSFEQSAKTIAQAMKLEGIMDFEVILHRGEMKMLEIDARFPSQTPMAVYASTGLNMVEILADQVLNRKIDSSFSAGSKKHVIIEHILASPRGIEVRGENIMKSCGPLHLEADFFGADEAVTSFVKGDTKWVATLIIKGKTRQETRDKRKQILEDLALKFNLPLLPDTNPYKT
jgi:pyrrolysine biosynthesis protein PylC